ncbi:MAG: periplasmic heavy metal sensor [Proteobacteria bacterium]|nr:periplasmic heavy metal sensor [Pseudomonadota bacterium]MBU1902258.1 periplasmic heavy metal sensor [Pseudomonadota bacterium]
MKKMSIVAAFLLVVASATWIMADPGGKGYGEGCGWGMGPSALASLNLTAEQSENIRALRETCLKEITPIRSNLFTKRSELKLLWIQTRLDPDKIRATQKEIQGLIGQLQEKGTNCRLSFRNILTSEQISKLLAQGFGRGGGFGCGKGKGFGSGRCPGGY